MPNGFWKETDETQELDGFQFRLRIMLVTGSGKTLSRPRRVWQAQNTQKGVTLQVFEELQSNTHVFRYYARALIWTKSNTCYSGANIHTRPQPTFQAALRVLNESAASFGARLSAQR